MKSRRLATRAAATIGGLAIVTMGVLTACGGEKKEEPTTSTTTTTSTPSVSPTEKGLDPTGGNKFTPTVKAPPPATAIPGDN